MAIEIEDGSLCDPSVSKIVSLFKPYQRVILHVGSASILTGPLIKLNKKRMNSITFGYSIKNDDLRSQSKLEQLLHEVSHGIEICDSRFVMPNWGLNLSRRSGGKWSYVFERELIVFAIQKRLHRFYGESLTVVDIAASLMELWRSASDWYMLQGVTEKASLRGTGKAIRGILANALDVIDASLGTTESLIAEWHRKCVMVEENPRLIVTLSKMNKIDLCGGYIEVRDPLSKSLRSDLRGIGIKV